MKHLRARGIAISGSSQKRKLKNIGYYHGYKGYRFAKKASTALPITDIKQIATLYDVDMSLKALFYPPLMSIETALKNYTLEAVLQKAGSERFEAIWRTCLTDYKSHTGGEYRKAWEKRQRLRREIDDIIFRNHKSRAVIGHFRDSDKDVPIWAIFEVMTLGNFGVFFDCLNQDVKVAVAADLGMPQRANLGSEFRIREIIFALKDLRNAIAHNGVILDGRFQTGRVSTKLTQLLRHETGINGVNFTDITDYLILVVYLMRKMKYSKTECRQLISRYQGILKVLRNELPYEIYSQIVKTGETVKLAALRSL